MPRCVLERIVMIRRLLASLTLVLVAIFTIAPVANFAQTPADSGIYTVLPGDTGWDLSRQYYDNAAIWQRIVDLNPFLQEAGRLFERDGKIILLLKPGEILVGLERLNVPAPTAVPIEQLVAPVPPVQAEAVIIDTGFNWFWLPIIGLVILGLVMLAKVFRRRYDEQTRREEHEHELRQDPITSGTPYVPGGIAPTDMPRLEHFFDQQATARYADRNPNLDRAIIRATRVGPIEEGTIVGEGMVGYLGGEMRPRRIETPLRAYQARYRFPDGTEEVLQCLMACMNPVTYGGDTYRGFTFTPTQAVVPVPEPERPAPQAVPMPAMVARMIRTAAGTDGNTTVTIGDQVLVFERGIHFNVDEATGAISMEGQSFKMTLQPRRQRRAHNETPRATGTSDK